MSSFLASLSRLKRLERAAVMLAHVLASDIGKVLSLLDEGSGLTPFRKSAVIGLLELRVLQDLGL